MNRKHDQIRQRISSCLVDIDMYSREAEQLLLLTGATESRYEYLKQYPVSFAFSWWQVESETCHDIWQNYLKFRPVIREKVINATHIDKKWMDEIPSAVECSNLLHDIIPFAISMARLVYRRVPKPLPSDIEGMGKYYIKYYNAGGKATMKKWQEGYDLIYGK